MLIVFYIILFTTIVLRLYELRLSKKNQSVRLSDAGTKLNTEKFFFLFVILHSSFLISVPMEIYFLERQFQEIGYLFILIYLVCLVLRFIVLNSLKENWNVKIIYNESSESSVTTSGLYQFIRHPNYLIVILEILSISLIHNAYISCILFSILNFIILFFRISKEEEILFRNPFYRAHFNDKKRFIPGVF